MIDTVRTLTLWEEALNPLREVHRIQGYSPAMSRPWTLLHRTQLVLSQIRPTGHHLPFPVEQGLHVVLDALLPRQSCPRIHGLKTHSSCQNNCCLTKNILNLAIFDRSKKEHNVFANFSKTLFAQQKFQKNLSQCDGCKVVKSAGFWREVWVPAPPFNADFLLLLGSFPHFLLVFVSRPWFAQ